MISRWELEERNLMREKLITLVGVPFPIPPEVEEAIKKAAENKVRIEQGGGWSSHEFELVLKAFAKWAGEKLFRENP